MKTLIFLNEEFQAEKIIKGTDCIIGKDTEGREIFSFKGIKDFSLFTLKYGAEFDTEEPTISDLQTQIFNLTTQLVNGGVI